MPRLSDIKIEPASPIAIEGAIAHVDHLIAADLGNEALIHAFSALEAIGRFALAPRLSNPITPGSVIETLTFDGLLDQEDADRLRDLAHNRNLMVHGVFGSLVTREDMEFVSRLLASLWAEVRQLKLQAAE